jgi:catechol 2,3-dioxygenase-like lactoylglutathione lyase family enzyme
MTAPRTTGSWLGLRHLALKVADPQRAKAFYCGLLGMTVEWEPDPDNVYLTSGQDNLALHRAAVGGGAGALDHFGFVVTRPEDVDAWEARARAFGATLAQPIKTHRDGARSFYFFDPDGHLIQILYHPPLAHLPGTAHPRPPNTPVGG